MLIVTTKNTVFLNNSNYVIFLILNYESVIIAIERNKYKKVFNKSNLYFIKYIPYLQSEKRIVHKSFPNVMTSGSFLEV